MNLHQSILLLGLDDEKGTYSISTSYLNYGFAAAILMDLILAERIEISSDHQIMVKRSALSDNKVLNEELSRIKKSKKPPKIKTWLHGMVQRNAKPIKKTIQALIGQGILKEEIKKVLWIIPVKRYPSLNVEPENSLRARLHRIIFEGAEPEPKERMLLSLIHACFIVNEIIPDKEKRKEAKERIKELTADSTMRKLVGDAIQEMQVIVTMVTTGAV